MTGELEEVTGTAKLFNDSGRNWTITAVRATVAEAPTGSSVVVDVNLNGTSIFGSAGDQPTIAPSETTNRVTSIATSTVADGDYLTVDVDSVGTSNPGADLVVQITVV